MAETTGIEWTDATWNCVRGCSIDSPGCHNCYAPVTAIRFAGPGLPYEGLAYRDDKGRARWTGKVRLVPEKLADPIRWKKPRRIFVDSMSDLFHEDVPDEFLDRVFAVMALTPRHTYQVLMKRAARMARYLSAPDLRGRIYRIVSAWLDQGEAGFLGRSWDLAHDLAGTETDSGSGRSDWTHWRLPLPNVWTGVSVENRKHGLPRVDALRATPAAIRFLSCEPLLEDLGQLDLTGISWVIVGGESGPGARPMHPDWARSIRDQCKAAGVPFFFKQWGEWAPLGPDSGLDPDHHYPGRGNRLSVPSGVPMDEPTSMFRVGKHAAGRLLDGMLHHEFPCPALGPKRGPG